MYLTGSIAQTDTVAHKTATVNTVDKMNDIIDTTCRPIKLDPHLILYLLSAPV